jgi:hypothetical protein
MNVQPASSASVEERCTRDFLQKAIGHLGVLEVVEVSVNRSGQYQMRPPHFDYPEVMANAMPKSRVIEGLPPFCEVLVQARAPSGHVTTITVWIPLAWNGRFLGTCGGGTRPDTYLEMPDILRVAPPPIALRNGFSTAWTDGGIRDRRHSAWGLNLETREVEWELTENWVHRSTHEMTVVAKAVTEAIYGVPAKYSYLTGGSGGGRQAMMEAQRYPDDYDGIWVADPAINFTKLMPALIWPALVMRWNGVVLPVAKLEAFRDAAIEACDGLDGLRDGIVGAFDPCEFDARKLVGRVTSAGVITEADAVTMAKIWDGPRTRNNDFLWYGLRPSSESWGKTIPGMGSYLSAEVKGKLEPQPHEVGLDFLKAWVARDPDLDWKTITPEYFEELFERSVGAVPDLATDNPDLSAFRNRGGKLILSHGADDQSIPVSGSTEYYRQVTQMIGSEDETRSFFRLFISEGDGHCVCCHPGPGLTTATAMAALMKWVEDGEAADEIMASELDFATGATLATRPVYAYPMVPRYKGEGDPKDASSFVPVHFSARARAAAAT